jgi:hypothetical protein
MARNYSELKTKNYHFQATLTASLTRSKRGVNILYNHVLSKCVVVLAKFPYPTAIWDLGRWVSPASETRPLQSKYWASWLAAVRCKQFTVLPVSPHHLWVARTLVPHLSTRGTRVEFVLAGWRRGERVVVVVERVTHLLRVNFMYCIARVRSRLLLRREGGVN